MKFWITSLAASLILFGCLTSDDDINGGGLKGSLTTQELTVMKIDESKKTITVIETNYDCDSTHLTTTYDTSTNYYEILDNKKLVVADTSKCTYQIMTGNSSSIFGLWTMDETDLTTKPTFEVPGCTKLERANDSIDFTESNLIENYSSQVSVSPEKVTVAVNGTICFANLLQSSSQFVMIDSSVQLTKVDCNTLNFKNADNQNGTIKISNSSSNTKITVSLGAANCALTLPSMTSEMTQAIPSCTEPDINPDSTRVFYGCIADLGLASADMLMKK